MRPLLAEWRAASSLRHTMMIAREPMCFCSTTTWLTPFVR